MDDSFLSGFHRYSPQAGAAGDIGNPLVGGGGRVPSPSENAEKPRLSRTLSPETGAGTIFSLRRMLEFGGRPRLGLFERRREAGLRHYVPLRH